VKTQRRSVRRGEIRSKREEEKGCEDKESKGGGEKDLVEVQHEVSDAHDRTPGDALLTVDQHAPGRE
jgi:hypothetical protein